MLRYSITLQLRPPPDQSRSGRCAFLRPVTEEDLKTETQSRITGPVLPLSPRFQRGPIGAGRW
jgi:hypothetical protein